jgi:hypothetical protein
MSEMVDRVAKALWESSDDTEMGAPWENLTGHWRKTYEDMARVAIAAMREPTQAMLDAGPVEPYMDAYVWAKMIDAALRE